MEALMSSTVPAKQTLLGNQLHQCQNTGKHPSLVGASRKFLVVWGEKRALKSGKEENVAEKLGEGGCCSPSKHTHTHTKQLYLLSSSSPPSRRDIHPCWQLHPLSLGDSSVNILYPEFRFCTPRHPPICEKVRIDVASAMSGRVLWR